MNSFKTVQELVRLRNKMDTTRTIITPVEENAEITKLSREVADRLQYGLLLDRYLLRNALAKLEIEILDQGVVDQYMKLVRRMKNHWFWTTWNWKTEPICNFRKPIPEFVLNKAVQIKRELPRVEICVSALVREFDQTFYPDPFLVASMDRWNPRREFYYVEVWDENLFEGRLRSKEKDGKQV